MTLSQVVGSIDDIQLEAEASLTKQLQQEADLLPLLETWLRWIRANLLPQMENLLPGKYSFLSELGTWLVRIVPGRDPARTTFALQIWLRNGASTRFMAIFAYRRGMVYNIDVKLLDTRFIWWAI